MATTYIDRDDAGLQADPRAAASAGSLYARRIDCAESSRAAERVPGPQGENAPGEDHDSRTRTGRTDAR
jgi:hypothetical protein